MHAQAGSIEGMEGSARTREGCVVMLLPPSAPGLMVPVAVHKAPPTPLIWRLVNPPRLAPACRASLISYTTRAGPCQYPSKQGHGSLYSISSPGCLYFCFPWVSLKLDFFCLAFSSLDPALSGQVKRGTSLPHAACGCCLAQHLPPTPDPIPTP